MGAWETGDPMGTLSTAAIPYMGNLAYGCTGICVPVGIMVGVERGKPMGAHGIIFQEGLECIADLDYARRA